MGRDNRAEVEHHYDALEPWLDPRARTRGVTMTKPYWQGECMLLSWSETSGRGRTVTLLLPEDDEHHPFRAATTKNGKVAGQRFMSVFVQIGEDEQPVHHEQKPSQVAAVICKDPQFWRWATERSFDTIGTEGQAAHWIRTEVGVDSRSDLDRDTKAMMRFNANILHPFNEYRTKVNVPL